MRKIISQHTFLCICFSIVLVGQSIAHDYIPGEVQEQPILLARGDLHTVSNGVMLNTDILFENGRITAIGKDLPLPTGGKVIDITDYQVYPGLIAPNSTVGIIEIGQVRATNDISERGRNNPDVQTHIAYNPDSEIIPTVRSNGITTALIVPGGGLIRGRSSLINLDGWTKEDAMEKENTGLHISWPRSSIITAWWMDKTADEQKKENEKNRRKIEEHFNNAKSYSIARKADPNLKIDSRWEAMLPVFDKTLPVIVHANDLRQIEQAIDFANKYDVRLIIAEGREAWKAADLLKDNDVAVILDRTQRMPLRSDDEYDLTYSQPKLLADAGVKFCLGFSGGDWSAWRCRNLPFLAGQAVAFGLDYEEALRSVTLSTAEILGVEKEIGSLEIGKKATLVVSKGDILDQLTNHVTLMYIEGREVNLDSKQKELYRKYDKKIERRAKSGLNTN
ncbi:MAG: amidohydrolase family protein [candidate division Zixibacteria bacterium]|nr:amidohydrolase family protein [candidate division Zixibacteria bacterium]